MREWMGYLVARNGGEDAAARMVTGIRVTGIRERILATGRATGIAHSPGDTASADISPADTSQADAVLANDIQAESVRTGGPMTLVYSGGTFLDDAIEEVGAIPDLSLFDRGSPAGQAASAGAGRM